MGKRLVGGKRVGAAVVVLCLAAVQPWAQASAGLGAQPDTGLAAARFLSNLYTQPEPAVGARFGAATGPLPATFRKAASTDALELWADPRGLSVAVVDRRASVQWRGTVSVPGSSGLNDTWIANLASGVLVEYVDPKEVLATESAAAGPAEVTLKPATGGFDADLSFPTSGISLSVEARLDGDSLVMRVPAASIHEGDNRLVSIRLLPFLGAVRGAETSGYLLIPDGSGALMRFRAPDTRSGTSWSQPVFGRDLGIVGFSYEDHGLVIDPPGVTLPVFGIARGGGAGAGGAGRAGGAAGPATGRSAFIAAIEEGATFATIDATPAGVTTDYTWACARFVYRRQFFQPTSKALGGITIFQKEANSFDAGVRWMFLAGRDADYVGMARRYQARLVERGLLVRRGIDPNRDVPIFFKILGADWKPGLLSRKRVVAATTTDQLTGMIDDLRARGVASIVAGYYGYQKRGESQSFPARFPVERQLGGDAGLARAASHLAQAGVTLALDTNYTAGFASAGGFSTRTDVARMLNGQPLGFRGQYFFSPRKSLSLASSDARQFSQRHLPAVMVSAWTSQVLYSDFGAGYPRDKAAAAMVDAFSRLREAGVASVLWNPNEYLLPAASWITDVPQYASLHVFETDSVPFTQIVLKGYVEYFAGPSNFMADPTEELLHSIDYGAYPSFFLTAIPSRELLETGSSNLFTTWYPDWRDRIVEEYATANRALKLVQGRRIQSRTVPRPGVAVVGYEGGISVVVNYTSVPYMFAGASVAPRGFAVVTDAAREDAHAPPR